MTAKSFQILSFQVEFKTKFVTKEKVVIIFDINPSICNLNKKFIWQGESLYLVKISRYNIKF